MAKQQESIKTQQPVLDWLEWHKQQLLIMAKQQELVQILASKVPEFDRYGVQYDPMQFQDSVQQFWSVMAQNPEQSMQAQMDLWQRYVAVCQQTLQRLQGNAHTDQASVKKLDRRFKDERWTKDPLFSHLRETYELFSEWLYQQTELLNHHDKKQNDKIRFAMRNFTDAMAPSNFWLTNPEVLDETIKTKGQNLLKGLENAIHDIKSSKTLPKVTMVNEQFFEVGRNLATTKGDVVFENDTLQLIQYAPLTETVYQTPLLIIAPWINKYYILDMQPENSFVRWAVEQGHTVFITSWKNAEAKDAKHGWFDRLEQGLFSVIEFIQHTTQQPKINAIGYCIGGTLLTTAMAYWAAKKQPSPLESATFFTCLIDFENSGELALFTDEVQIKAMEKTMASLGYLDAWHTHTTFNLLRANDLIWSFVVNNYLLGRDPMAFDLLYWNSDSTRIPAALHSFYLRQMYMKNNLAKGKLVVNKTTLDVRKIKTPSYFVSAIDDHIAPWQATYEGALLLGGDVTFTLSGSGHIAGIVNPPQKNKYGFWTNQKLPKSSDNWLKKATQQSGSWWPHWAQWVAGFSGNTIPARHAKHSIEPAPGRYVKVRVL